MAMSPVWNHPSTIAASVASGRFRVLRELFPAARVDGGVHTHGWFS